MEAPARARGQTVARRLSFLLAAASCAVGIYLSRFRAGRAAAVTHPNLALLRAGDGREVLLIGTVPVDLEEESSHLVIDALRALRPEVVMLEGTPLAGVQAMVSSGRWEMRGMRKPNDTDWMHLNPDIQPVEVIREPPKKRHFPFFSGPAAVPERSLVPIKVSFWAYHLTSAVGGNIAAAVTTAASQGVPVRFLGPRDSGVLPGFLKVQQIAEQAAKELLEEERRKGQLSSDAMNTALQRAEKHIREDQDKWLHDARGEAKRFIERIKEVASEEDAAKATGMMEELATFLADGVSSTMKDFQRGALVLSVDKFPFVQDELEKAGFVYISHCTS